MLLIPTIPFRRPRTRRAAALNLVWATYQSGVSVTLSFNQPVDVTGVAVNSFIISDAPGAKMYTGQSASLLDPSTVKITLIQVGPAGGAEVTMEADSDNGIRTIPAGQPWPGVEGLVLPYP